MAETNPTVPSQPAAKEASTKEAAAKDPAAKDPPAQPPRQAWARAFTRLAWISGVFCLILGGLLIDNSIRLYRGFGNGKVRVVEARELLPLKATLREDPKNDELKNRIRELDQKLRDDYFRRERLASRGGWILLGTAAVFVIALQSARHLRKPPFRMPVIARHPTPARPTSTAVTALAGASLLLAGLAAPLLWDAAPQVRPLMHALTGTQASSTDTPATGSPNEAIDPSWFPSDEEIAAQWPRFRGPNGSGVVTQTGLPEAWNGTDGTHIAWKAELDLPGENSAIIWDDRVYVTGADDKRRMVYCFNAHTGTPIWRQPVSTPQGSKAEELEVMEDTGFAAPTAVTDGKRVFAMFANGEIAGFSSAGVQLWARHLGTPENMYGHATSLLMWRNRVIVVFDQATADDAKSQILALDANTGKTIWSTPRPVANSWVSPIVITAAGKPQVITSADPWVIAYNPEDGSEIWKAELMRGDVAPSPVFANGLVYVACDQTCIAAIKPDGSGDVTKTHVAWQQEDAGLPDMSSLLCDGPRLYTLVFGVLYAFDALTGEALWEHDTNEKFQSSPCLHDGKLHMLTNDGVMISGEATKDGFKETGRSELGEGAGASPSIAHGRIYIRGRKHLFCIGAKDGQ